MGVGVGVLGIFCHRMLVPSSYHLLQTRGSETMVVTRATCSRIRIGSGCRRLESSIPMMICNLPCVGGSIQLPIEICYTIKCPMRVKKCIYRGRLQGRVTRFCPGRGDGNGKGDGKASALVCISLSPFGCKILLTIVVRSRCSCDVEAKR